MFKKSRFAFLLVALAIVPVSRSAGSGTCVTFETYVLGTKENLPRREP